MQRECSLDGLVEYLLQLLDGLCSEHTQIVDIMKSKDCKALEVSVFGLFADQFCMNLFVFRELHNS